MDLNWKHQHRRMDENLKQKLDALEGSYASPQQNNKHNTHSNHP
jgi:hypothetical protein